MKQFFRWTTVGVLVMSLALPVLGVANRRDPEVICRDGEKYIINEWEPLLTVDTQKQNSDLIVIDKKLVRLTLYRDGKEFKRWTVAIGTPSTPSPVGEWKIIHKGGSWGGGFGARWMGLNVPWGIYGIHGTNKPGSIGYMSSHGCIRMHNQNVIELYNTVQVGTPVHIVGELAPVKLRKSYHRGMTGEDVLKVQFAIRKRGFDLGPADARYGPGMEQAVIKMQQFYGFPTTGKLTPNELCLLDLQ